VVGSPSPYKSQQAGDLLGDSHPRGVCHVRRAFSFTPGTSAEREREMKRAEGGTGERKGTKAEQPSEARRTLDGR
jgi:hypothetical protein